MIKIRKAADRGHASHGWLDSWHTFSFADYFDRDHMGVGNLRVINDDTIAPGAGFGTHGHRDMEIISYVLEGELAHKDSMGNGHPGTGSSGIIRPGDVQRMSAGTGVRHSEFNNLNDRATHFLQIWILPHALGVDPGYEQKHFDMQHRRGRLALIASRDGVDGSVRMNADASISAGLFDGAESVVKPLSSERLTYVHLARGGLLVNGQRLAAGDGALLEDETQLTLNQGQAAEVLVFDLARM